MKRINLLKTESNEDLIINFTRKKIKTKNRYSNNITIIFNPFLLKMECLKLSCTYTSLHRLRMD